MEELDDQIRKLMRKFPCFICLVRFFCADFTEVGRVNVNDRCGKFVEWKEEQERILSEISVPERYDKDHILFEESRKIMEEERERNVAEESFQEAGP